MSVLSLQNKGSNHHAGEMSLLTSEAEATHYSTDVKYSLEEMLASVQSRHTRAKSLEKSYKAQKGPQATCSQNPACSPSKKRRESRDGQVPKRPLYLKLPSSLLPSLHFCQCPRPVIKVRKQIQERNTEPQGGLEGHLVHQLPTGMDGSRTGLLQVWSEVH